MPDLLCRGDPSPTKQPCRTSVRQLRTYSVFKNAIRRASRVLVFNAPSTRNQLEATFRNLDLDRLPCTCIFQPHVHELRWQSIAARQVCAGHQLIVEVRVLGRPRASDFSDDLPARDRIADLRPDRAVLQMPERAVLAITVVDEETVARHRVQRIGKIEVPNGPQCRAWVDPARRCERRPLCRRLAPPRSDPM